MQSRRVALVGSVSWGESIRYGGMPFLGRGRLGSLTAIFRPVSRLQSQLNVELSRLEDPRTSTLVFDIQVLRALTTFQFTERLLLRNILGAQLVRPDARRQPAADLPRQLRNGVLPGLRRPLPAGGSARPGALPHATVPADQPRDLHEGVVPVPVLMRRGSLPRGRRRFGSRDGRCDRPVAPQAPGR